MQADRVNNYCIRQTGSRKNKLLATAAAAVLLQINKKCNYAILILNDIFQFDKDFQTHLKDSLVQPKAGRTSLVKNHHKHCKDCKDCRLESEL